MGTDFAIGKKRKANVEKNAMENMKISKAVGIDLGTTNSVIAMVGNDNKTIICRTDKTGQKTFPSVVVYDKKSDKLRAGRFAFNARGTAKEPIV